VTIVSTWTVVLGFIVRFFNTALRVGCVIAYLYTGLRIVVRCTEFFTTLKAPGPTTPGANYKFTLRCETTREDIVTRIIFETPTLAPGTLFRVLHSIMASLFLSPFIYSLQIEWSWTAIQR